MSSNLLVLASGDGKANEFGTSFYEILRKVLGHPRYDSWQIHLALIRLGLSQRGECRKSASTKMKQLVERADRGGFIISSITMTRSSTTRTGSRSVSDDLESNLRDRSQVGRILITGG